jgi:NtrC-family two-component system response regulator AlgB
MRGLLERIRALRIPSRGFELALFLESANPAMRRATATARMVAASDAAVLVTGESGTGKATLAGLIHAWSRRSGGPFVRISCGALRHDMTEAELVEEFRPASTGTLFLDDLDGFPVELQAKLLHALPEQRFEFAPGGRGSPMDVRVVAATTRDLDADVRAGRLREDLFYRLSVVPIALPPLRERAEDIPGIVRHVLARLAVRHRRTRLDIAPDVLRRLCEYPWPGNVRELLNVLERAVLLSTGEMIGGEDLPTSLVGPCLGEPRALASSPASLDALERAHVTRVLADSTSLGEAASRLGINPSTLWRKRKRWGLE